MRREDRDGSNGTIVRRAQGAFGLLLVIDDGPMRHLRFGGVDGVDQTVVHRRRPGDLPTEYLQVATVGAALTKTLSRALLVGLGGGAYARFLRRRFPQVSVDVIEIDPIVLQLAREHFGFKEDRRLRVFTEDAAEFVADAAADEAWRYDLVFVDAYHGQKIPAPLARQRFFRDAAAVLAPGGVVVANLGLPERWQEDRVVRRFATAFRGGCIELAVPGEDNRILVGCGAGRPGERRLRGALRELDARGVLPFALEPFAAEIRTWS